MLSRRAISPNPKQIGLRYDRDFFTCAHHQGRDREGRQQTFEAAKEKDKDRTIVPDARFRMGPRHGPYSSLPLLGKGPLSLRVSSIAIAMNSEMLNFFSISIGTSLFTITVSNNGLNSMKSGGYGTRFRKPSDV